MNLEIYFKIKQYTLDKFYSIIGVTKNSISHTVWGVGDALSLSCSLEPYRYIVVCKVGGLAESVAVVARTGDVELYHGNSA